MNKYLIPKRIAYLHNHTNRSIRDGIPEVIQYKNKLIEMQRDTDIVGFAITDHGVMSAIVEQYNEIEKGKDSKGNKCNAKAIYGCELYMCETRMYADIKERYHIVVLAKTQEGLSNLYSLVSVGGINAVESRKKKYPRIEESEMKKFGKGLIATSACIGGIIPQLIINGNYQQAKEKALLYNSFFDEFYLEVQPHEIPEQLLVNQSLIQMSQEIGIPLVITCDTHYIEKQHSVYHDILKFMDHMKGFTTKNYLMSFDEIYNYCIKYNIPLSCITNTVKIAERCNVDPSCKDSKGMLPVFTCPRGYNPDTYLRTLCYDNFFKQIQNKGFTNIRYRMNRLNYELDVISSAGFSSYFLILWDWFKRCAEQDILMGPGRGSAAASEVCYLLNITTVDPIYNKFVFERFLNKQRLEYPDKRTVA